MAFTLKLYRVGWWKRPPPVLMQPLPTYGVFTKNIGITIKSRGRGCFFMGAWFIGLFGLFGLFGLLVYCAPMPVLAALSRVKTNEPMNPETNEPMPVLAALSRVKTHEPMNP